MSGLGLSQWVARAMANSLSVAGNGVKQTLRGQERT